MTGSMSESGRQCRNMTWDRRVKEVCLSFWLLLWKCGVLKTYYPQSGNDCSLLLIDQLVGAGVLYPCRWVPHLAGRSQRSSFFPWLYLGSSQVFFGRCCVCPWIFSISSSLLLGPFPLVCPCLVFIVYHCCFFACVFCLLFLVSMCFLLSPWLLLVLY